MINRGPMFCLVVKCPFSTLPLGCGFLQEDDHHQRSNNFIAAIAVTHRLYTFSRKRPFHLPNYLVMDLRTLLETTAGLMRILVENVI